MPKAIVVAVGDTPLNPLNDLLKQNSISSKVIDATTSSVDEIDKLIHADDQGQCVLLKGVSSLSQHIPRIADATEKLVLLYCSPVTALGNAVETSNGTVKPEQVINRWQESVSQAMELVEESELCSLCDLNDVLEHSSLFLKEFFALEKAAETKPSLFPSLRPPQKRWRRPHCLLRARFGLDRRAPAGSAFARRWRRAAATVEVLGPLFGVPSLLPAEGSKPLSPSALRRLPCAAAPFHFHPSNFQLVNSGKVIPF